jgi:hypothetical protein
LQVWVCVKAERHRDSGCEKRIRGNGKNKKGDMVPGQESEGRTDQDGDCFGHSVVSRIDAQKCSARGTWKRLAESKLESPDPRSAMWAVDWGSWHSLARWIQV